MGMIVDFNHGRKWMRMNISNKLFVLAAFAAVISLASVSCEKKGDKAATTADNSPINILYDTPQLWAGPIDDYLKVGNENYPDGFNKNIGTLDVFDNKLWIGYGDMTRNMGSNIPIEFRRFDDPSRPDIVSTPVSAEGQGAKQRTPTDTGEEQIYPFRKINGQLWQAGHDSNSDDETWMQAIPGQERLIQGNIFVLDAKNGDLVWEKRRNIPGGEHVHDLAYFNGSIYGVGSGADHRREWESGQIFRYLWQSDDMGMTFKTIHRVMVPDTEKGDDTRYRALLSVGNTLYVFGYMHYRETSKLEGRHVTVKNNQISGLNGAVGSVVVRKTWPLHPMLGLAVGNYGPGVSRTFKIIQSGIKELSGWSNLRVIYVTPGEKSGHWLVLAGSGTDEETFSVYRFYERSINQLSPVLDLGEMAFSSIALWYGDLFLGSDDGKIYRSNSIR